MSVLTDKLLPSSPCDPKYPLLILLRTRIKKPAELKELLISRNYKNVLVDAAIEKARQIPRSLAIERVSRIRNKPSRPVLAITFDPRLPQILKKLWRTMVKTDPHLAETFPLPP